MTDNIHAAMCIYCGEAIIYDTREVSDIAAAHAQIKDHDQQCHQNPLVARIADLEASHLHLSFKLLRGANNERQAEWPGADKADTTFKALEVCGEAGELAEAVKKLMRGGHGIAGTKAGLGNVADELADVVISADLLAAHLEINLASSIASKFNKTSDKYGLLTRMDEGLT
ncbi:hypothetical protein [Vreelandella sp. GE22]